MYYRKLGIKLLLHPGTYFGFIWLTAVISQLILELSGIKFLTPFPEFVNEMNVLVIFTGICFIFIIFLTPNYFRFNHKIKILFINKSLYKIVSYLTLFGATFKLVYTWYMLGVAWNLAEIRVAYAAKRGYFNDTVSLFSLLSYMNFFYTVISIIAGYCIGLLFQFKRAPIRSRWLLSIPFVVTIIYTLTIGGRNPLAYGIKLYLFGFALSLVPQTVRILSRKLIIYIILGVFSFFLFTTYVAEQRDEVAGNISFSQYLDNTYLKPFSGIIQYMNAHYWGYQLRRFDSFDPNNLGYGKYTFYGILNFRVPFSNALFGTDISILDFFSDLSYNKLDYFALQADGREGYYTTRSVYLEMICDYGQIGIFVFILVFVFLTNYLYILIEKRRLISVISILPLFFVFSYWSSSNFQSVFATNVYGPIISFFVYDFLNKKV
ncbi:O-antigen polymerase [Caldisericum sp.]|uniref:O-antigen polymerase n=1 Tax=Caldisericum sp. TaxID=2499687 RepID=UPI003D114A82